MSTMEQLERRIASIEERNRRVELDKEWETSAPRRVLIFLATYCILGLFLWAVGVHRPWLDAVIPAVGFALSTFTLRTARRRWERRRAR